MTKEDARYYLRSSGFSEEQIDTIEQAFKQEPKEWSEMLVMCDNCGHAIHVKNEDYEQEPCEDAISRQAVLEQIKGWLNYELRDMTNPLYYLEKRLNELPSVNAIQHTSNASKDVEQRTNTLGDAVSRQAVLDAIRRISLGQTDVVKVSMMTEDYVKHLPSVTQKTGHWILTSDDDYEYCTCSECGYQNGENWMIGSHIKFCQECGAKMQEVEE